MNGAEQQSLPGLDLERATVLSPSALERYRLCPLLYRFLYVDGLWRMSRSSASQAFGNSVHAALREFYRLPVGRRSLRMLLELFRRLWVRDGYQGGEQQRRERERGAEALRAWYGRTDTTVVPTPPSWGSRPPGATSSSRAAWTGSTPTRAATAAWSWSTTRPAGGRSVRRRPTPTRP